MPESVSQVTDICKGRDTPPHMADDSIFDQPKLKIPLELVPISGPTYDGDTPKTLRKGLYSTDELWGPISVQWPNCGHTIKCRGAHHLTGPIFLII